MAASFWSSIAFTERARKSSELELELEVKRGSGMPFLRLLEQEGQMQVKK